MITPKPMLKRMVQEILNNIVNESSIKSKLKFQKKLGHVLNVM
jgi:hypothetical protein